MRLSTKARYALRMIVDVATHEDGNRPVSLGTVAGRTGLSRGYLEQLALPLRRARILRAVAGRSGGYALARSPEAITVGDIIEASIGSVILADCLEAPDSCPGYEGCECRVFYALANEGIHDILHHYTLANLIDPRWVTAHGGALRPGPEEGPHPSWGCGWRSNSDGNRPPGESMTLDEGGETDGGTQDRR